VVIDWERVWPYSIIGAGACPCESTYRTGWVFALAFTPDGRALASGGEDAAVKLWQVATGRELANFKGRGDYVHSVSFAPNEAIVATGSRDKTIKLRETDQVLGFRSDV
jgi:WD40 repeat protein